MAETPQTTPNADRAPPREAEAPSGRKGQIAAGEARSFLENGAAPGALTPEGASAFVQDAVASGRQLAESGRRAGREVAESWRTSLEPFAAVQQEMNRWFDDAFRHMTGFGLFPSLRAARPFAAASAAPLFGLPATDIKETEKAYLLAVELPGLAREDVEISIDGDLLIVSGHKAEAREDAAAAYRISERRYGRFERSFPLPADVERTHIEAAFRDGVLKITLPRDPAAAPKRARIEIKG